MCAGKFPVASASAAVIAGYDVQLKKPDGTATSYTSRTSYVIGRDGRVAFVHDDMNPAEHVQLTLAAVRRLSVK